MEKFISLLKQASHTVVFTGAGMSTESGLPDFRSAEGGLWEKFNPNELANVDALYNNQTEFTKFYQHRLSSITEHEPHDGHLILADWEKSGIIHGIITQNVDGFHHDAGSKNVMELHGTFRTFYCHDCGREHPRDDYLRGDATCYACNGIVRPGIILFGETLQQDVFTKAEAAALEADLFIVLGSSLTVSPANMFPLQAVDSGAKFIIVNNDPTPFDSEADLVIQDRSIKEVLAIANQAIS